MKIHTRYNSVLRQVNTTAQSSFSFTDAEFLAGIQPTFFNIGYQLPLTTNSLGLSLSAFIATLKAEIEAAIFAANPSATKINFQLTATEQSGNIIFSNLSLNIEFISIADEGQKHTAADLFCSLVFGEKAISAIATKITLISTNQTLPPATTQSQQAARDEANIPHYNE